MKLRLFITISSFGYFLAATNLHANDGYSAVGAGGITFLKSEDIRLKTEVLTISTQKISVRYEFINESKKDIHATLAFPLPKISCGYWGKNKGIDDFSALVDGKAIKLKKEEKAFQFFETGFGKDITPKVVAAHLPLDCRKVYADKALFKKAQKAKLADNYKGTDPENVRYATQITYYWQQNFPSKKPVVIEHSYTPMTGYEMGGISSAYLNLSPHWDREVDFFSKNENGHYIDPKTPIVDDFTIQYILTTAKTWKGAIGHFKLILKRDSPKIIVGSTLGPLKKIDDNTLEFQAWDFIPDRELTVIFANPK